jgi:hypothetical protein
MLECWETLLRWGFTIPPRENVHSFVRLRFVYPADPDLKTIGRILEVLGQLRNDADYRLTAPRFRTDVFAQKAAQDASRALALLDAIDGDSARQAAAIASIRAAFP